MALLMRPGYTLFLAGIVSFLASRVIGIVPLIGGALVAMTLLFGMFAVLGGVWLIMAEWRSART